MGDSLRDALAKGAADSDQFKALRRAIAKSNGDRAAAFRLVARQMNTRPDMLPLHICRMIDAMLDGGRARR